MRRHILLVLTAIGLFAGVYSATLAAHRAAARTTSVPTTPVVAKVMDPTLAQSELDVRTGDAFWGLHLDGVVPCSSMLVKGGGHLVMISRSDDPDARCYYHVRDSKVVELAQQRFNVAVVDTDVIHVSREPIAEVASTVAGR